MKKFLDTFSILTILAALLIFCSSCSNNTNMQESNDISYEANSKEIYVMSYKKYQELFEALVNEIRIEGFTLKGSTLGESVIIVEEELTFGTRDHLTLDGNFNTDSTDEIIIFENDSETTQVAVRVSYTKNFIGNDLISRSSTRGFNNTNDHLSKMSDFAILTYRNLVISVSQLSIDQADNETTKEFLRYIIQIINDKEQLK